MDDFVKELKTGFLIEATQLLSDTEQCFLSLESSPGDLGLLDKIFRLAHNLKGSSKAVGFDEMGAFSHELESLLLKIKSGEIQITALVVSLLLRCNDLLSAMVAALSADMDAHVDCAPLIQEIRTHLEGKTVVLESAPDAVLEPVSEPVSETPTQESSAVAPIQIQAGGSSISEVKSAPSTAADETIRVSLARLEKLLNFVGELVILQTVLKEQAVGSNPTLLRKTAHQMGKVTKEIQDISMSLRMVPVKQTFQKMQRIVRDTSSMLGKKIQLNIQGEETELDKTVLENLSDPLVHVIRNAADHGIESPEERIKGGKPETGQILLQAYHRSGKLVIEVSDDGAGIHPQRILKKAIEKGILEPGAKIGKEEAINLIFHPGFSTKAEVTEVSGRGVGMDVVKTNIELLQGEVQVESEENKGTTLRIVLPLTLAIIDGMIVKSQAERFVIPLSHVHESVNPNPNDVKHIPGFGDVLLLRGENLPLYTLSELLGCKVNVRHPGGTSASPSIALIIRTQAKPFAVLVDDIVGQHQVVVKKLGKEIQSLKGLAGSAILGDGKPALILELPELINRPVKTQARAPMGAMGPSGPVGRISA